jgi:protein TonB
MPYFVRRVALKQTQRATLPIESSQASIASAAALGAKTIRVPEIVSNVAPHYPQRALSAGHEGTVYIRVTIDDNGLVIAALAERSSGVASLDAAAMEAIWLWRFSPAVEASGVARQVIVPIDFVLRD